MGSDSFDGSSVLGARVVHVNFSKFFEAKGFLDSTQKAQRFVLKHIPKILKALNNPLTRPAIVTVTKIEKI
jgi:hypothetical protein